MENLIALIERAAKNEITRAELYKNPNSLAESWRLSNDEVASLAIVLSDDYCKTPGGLRHMARILRGVYC